MAAITADIKPRAGGSKLIKWLTLTTTNSTGAAVSLPQNSIKTISIIGTFNGATVNVRGSNDGGTTFHSFNIVGSGALVSLAAIAAATGGLIVENYEEIDIVVTGGDGSTDLDILIMAV